MSRALPGKTTDRRAAGQKEFAAWGQKTCGSAPKASGLAEARGRLREPAEPNGGSSSSSLGKTHRFGDPERREIPPGGGCVCLQSSRSHPVLFACADDPARSRGEVATGCHSHPTSEPLHGAPRAPPDPPLLLGQGGRVKGGGGGNGSNSYTPEQQNINLAAAGQESRPFFPSAFDSQGAARIFQPARSVSVRYSQRKAPGK